MLIDELLTAEMLAARLKISKQAVYSYTRRGIFSVIRIGKHFRYNYSDVILALSACSLNKMSVEEQSPKRSLKTKNRITPCSRKE